MVSNSRTRCASFGQHGLFLGSLLVGVFKNYNLEDALTYNILSYVNIGLQKSINLHWSDGKTSSSQNSGTIV